MNKAVIVAIGVSVLFFVVGVDPLHCLAIGLFVIIIGLIATSMDPVDHQPEPDPLPIPYGTTLLRSVVFTNPRSNDPIGDNAGRRAWQVWRQAMIDFPGDPVLARYGDRPADQWRFLPQRELVALLNRVDELDLTRRDRPRRVTPSPYIPDEPSMRTDTEPGER